MEETFDCDGAARVLKNFREQRISLSSRKGYLRSEKKFIKWLMLQRPELLTPEFSSKFTDHGDEKLIKELLILLSIPPIHFHNLTADTFMSWVQSVRKKDGTPLSNSGYANYRSALVNLFADYKVKMSDERIECLFYGVS